MTRLLFIAAVVAATLPATASAAKPAYCTEKGVTEVLVANDESPGEGVAELECADVTKDGSVDAVFSILSGGTAGATQFGVISDDGLLLLKDGYKISIDVVNDHRFDVQQPIYKKNDANCCPSGAYFDKYVWVGQNFDVRKGPKYKKAKTRFFG